MKWECEKQHGKIKMKAFFRLLTYILNYKTLFIIAILCSLVYASMNGLSVYLIGPFLNKLFSSETVVEKNITPETEIGTLQKIKIKGFSSLIEVFKVIK